MSPNLHCRQWGFYRPSGLKGVAVNPRNALHTFSAQDFFSLGVCCELVRVTGFLLGTSTESAVMCSMYPFVLKWVQIDLGGGRFVSARSVALTESRVKI